MSRGKKIAILIFLSFIEIVFLSWIFEANLPHRSADVAAFTRYQDAPTEENKARWLKEREITQSEVRLRTSLGVSLAVGNLFLVMWTASRRIQKAT
jgi:hypothetical protein